MLLQLQLYLFPTMGAITSKNLRVIALRILYSAHPKASPELIAPLQESAHLSF